MTGAMHSSFYPDRLLSPFLVKVFAEGESLQSNSTQIV